MKLKKYFLIFFSISLLGFSVFPQENGLYGSKAPEDKAFVRVFNNTGTKIPEISVGTLLFKNISTDEISVYRPISPGIYLLKYQNGETELIPQTGQFFTIIISNDSLTLLQDERHDDNVDSQLVLYNVSETSSISLKTSDKATTVISVVEPYNSRVVTVNPVDVNLAVFSEEEKISNVGSINLQSGQSYSIFVLQKDDDVFHLIKQAEIQTE